MYTFTIVCHLTKVYIYLVPPFRIKLILSLFTLVLRSLIIFVKDDDDDAPDDRDTSPGVIRWSHCHNGHHCACAHVTTRIWTCSQCD